MEVISVYRMKCHKCGKSVDVIRIDDKRPKTPFYCVDCESKRGPRIKYGYRHDEQTGETYKIMYGVSSKMTKPLKRYERWNHPAFRRRER